MSTFFGRRLLVVSRRLPIFLCLVLAVGGCSRRSSEPLDDPSAEKVDVLGDSSDPVAASGTGDNRLEQAANLADRGELAEAWELIQQDLVVSPNRVESLRLAAAIQGRMGNYLEAGGLARRIAELDSENASSVLVGAFDLHLRGGNFEQAEQDLLLAEKYDPESIQVQRLLAQLLNAQGRRFEASGHVRNLIRLRAIQPNELLSMVDLRGPFYLVSFDEFSREGVPDLLTLGKIRFRYAATRSDREAELANVRELSKQFPGSAAVAAFHGRILSDMGRFDLMEAWSRALPREIERQPEYWNAIGTWMARQQRHEEAIRSFGESVRRDPGDRESLRSMVAELLTLGENEKANAVRERLADLDRLFRIAKEADEEQANWISEMLQEHARPWESSAWLLYAAQAGNRVNQIIEQLDQRHSTIVNWEQGAEENRILEARLQRLLGFSMGDWNLPDLQTIQTIDEGSLAGLDQGLRMDDVSKSLGLTTSLVSGFPLDGSAMYPHQTNGGGIATFDYDLDGYCDLYLVQSGGNPQEPLSSAPNELMRWYPEGKFTDVSLPTNSQDRGFGQGVCAGDINQDGWIDLIVANIGPNAVYLNQGDGSFRKSNEWLANAEEMVWTSSLGLADLDGDHLPDLVEVNYIDDESVFERSCTSNYLDCQPQAFRKCADSVFRMRPEGGFELWRDGFQSEVTPKLGFGVVIANFDRKHGNDFFISNDGDLNHYWVSSPQSESEPNRFHLRESGTLLGCSIGRGGNSQACMGIASGDFDRDGTLDLHVTNFLKEPVNLFMQSATGTFVDEAIKYRVAEPSRGVLGFGTQAADLDNDGWLDLAVLNGHVFDGRADEIPLQMQPQLMRGSRQGFALQNVEQAGDYWSEKSVGRTLAVFDLNRDGRLDFVANHLDQPVAVLANRSSTLNWLQLQLIGTQSERDAIGAEVTLLADGQRWTAWQLGGDGLMSSNEPIVHFGIGEVDRVDELQVTWPSGRVQRFNDISVNQRLLLVEGQAEFF